jgi:hypothetical protein
MRPTLIVPLERIDGLIHLVRNQKVMLDSDLAALWAWQRGSHPSCETKSHRFPNDFMFPHTEEIMRVCNL